MGFIDAMSRKQKHVPQRTCVICRQKVDKRQLTRLVKRTEGVYIDPSGKSNGRGAYVCDNANCREQAASTNVLNKALRTILSDEDRQRLRDFAS